MQENITDLRAALQAVTEEAAAARSMWEEAMQIIDRKNAEMMDLKRNKGVDELQEREKKLREYARAGMERAHSLRYSCGGSFDDCQNSECVEARAALE